MTTADTRRAGDAAGFDDGLSEALVKTSRFFRKGDVSVDMRSLHQIGGREADSFYRDRWAHDKVVRSTHGVNCTGSCSWKVYVTDGIITCEAQQTDYPSTGPDRPEYEPRGCPRGAAFSWYTYSPTRVRYPCVRGSLLTMYREARQRLGDPVLAWADIVNDPEKARTYKSQRGKGGLAWATWDEATEMIAAAHVHTIKEYGPDRVAGFSPIPAMSMVSHAAGSRFMSLIGAPMLAFYDWCADLPVASYRRRTIGPAFSATTRNDEFMYIVLTATILFGMSNTVLGVLGHEGVDDRDTVSPWFRSIFYFQPQPELMGEAGLGFQLHALSALLLFAIWPFTRLVHVFGAPLRHLTRPYIGYRSRDEHMGSRDTPRGWDRVGGPRT